MHAAKTFLRGFIRFDLSSGKFPLERHAHDGASLRGKNESVTLDNGAGDVDMLLGANRHFRTMIPGTDHVLFCFLKKRGTNSATLPLGVSG